MLVYKEKYSIFVTIFASAFVTVASFVATYLFDNQPCFLCKATRLCFICLFFISLFSLKYKIFYKILVVFCFVLMALAFYHLGVENNWWAEPAICKAKLSITVEEIMNANDVSCSTINWTIFGLSSTLYSYIVAAFLFWLNSISFVANYVQIQPK